MNGFGNGEKVGHDPSTTRKHPGPVGRVPSVGIFLRDPSPYLRKFQRHPRTCLSLLFGFCLTCIQHCEYSSVTMICTQPMYFNENCLAQSNVLSSRYIYALFFILPLLHYK